MTEYIRIIAGSSYGRREAWYEVVDPGYLVCIHEGDHDNLAGNYLVTTLGGLTVEEAQERIEALNTEPVGHAYDGCHACQWRIELEWPEEEDIPRFLTYEASDVGVALLNLIGDFLTKNASFSDLREAKDMLEAEMAQRNSGEMEPRIGDMIITSLDQASIITHIGEDQEGVMCAFYGRKMLGAEAIEDLAPIVDENDQLAAWKVTWCTE